MVNGDDWFENPLDSMPIAKDEPSIRPVFGGCYNYERLKAEGLVGKDLPTNRYAPPEKMLELESMNPRPEEEVADWFQETNVEETKETPHHIAYEIATAKYNPFSVGGSESIHDFQGGSENVI